VRAVDEVSFEVHPGETFGLLGPNGAGKTTTIRMMLDIFKPDCGQVALFGSPWHEAAKRRIGYMPEERGLYRDLKLEPTLVYLATLKGINEADARQRVAHWLRRLDLYESRHKKIQDLSRGMQQKAQFVATLVHEPDLIVVDEPFANLDPVNTRLAMDILAEQAQRGAAVIMSTHLMFQVEAMCNRIVLINKGRTVLYGGVAQIKREFSTHAILVAGQGDFASLPGVLEARQENHHWRLALAAGTEPQSVLAALIARPDVRLDRFELAEPSLDDIFIQVVHEQRGEARP
jgi:ABC-2 type transport system ATP-binding protein